MRSFMVVNPGRAASRAFYLNLAAQPGIVIPARHDVDRAVAMWTRRSDERPLDDLLGSVLRDASGASPPTQHAIVFHGVRPRLAQPFDSDVNKSLLAAIRDRLGVDTIYFPVRDAWEVVVSEYNRRLAGLAGDWKFRPGNLGWRASYSVQELLACAEEARNGSPDEEPQINVDPGVIAMSMASTTARTTVLHELFDDVFTSVEPIDYRAFLDGPLDVYERIATENGFEFVSRGLVLAKVNSLSNRFMIWNPMVLEMSVPVRVRFEIEGAIGLCKDWGVMVPTGVDCSPLAEVADAVGSPIGLGIMRDDLDRANDDDRRRLADTAFLQRLVDLLGAIFMANYRSEMNRYRRLYVREPPESVLEIMSEQVLVERAAQAAWLAA